jgi:hypothetical protein
MPVLNLTNKEYKDVRDNLKRDLESYKDKLTQENIEKLFNKTYIKSSLEQEELKELKEKFLEYKDESLTDAKINQLLSDYKEEQRIQDIRNFMDFYLLLMAT